MLRPTFSVIIPVYNAETTLGAAVQSVTQQTFQEFEILIVDDRSTDGSFDLALDWSQRDDRIRTFRLKANTGGPIRPRNEGLVQADGLVFAFLDADDRWLPTKLEKQLDKHENGNFALTYTRCLFDAPDDPLIDGLDYPCGPAADSVGRSAAPGAYEVELRAGVYHFSPPGLGRKGRSIQGRQRNRGLALLAPVGSNGWALRLRRRTTGHVQMDVHEPLAYEPGRAGRYENSDASRHGQRVPPLHGGVRDRRETLPATSDRVAASAASEASSLSCEPNATAAKAVARQAVRQIALSHIVLNFLHDVRREENRS